MRLCFCWVPGIDWSLLPLVVRAACGHCVTTRSTPTADSCVVLSCISIDTRVVNTICFRPGTPSHAVPWQLAGRRHRGCAAWTLPWGTASDYAALQGDVGTTRVNATATWAVPAAASLAVQHRLKLSLFNSWTDSGRSSDTRVICATKISSVYVGLASLPMWHRQPAHWTVDVGHHPYSAREASFICCMS